MKSGRTRLVIRRTSKHMRVQFIEALPDGDKTLVDASSYKLADFGWDTKGGNLPAAYLTGYLAGKMAMAGGIEDGILDLGLQTNTKRSRIYAALKGVIDSGVEIPAANEIFPEEEAVKGEFAESVDGGNVDKVISSIDGKF